MLKASRELKEAYERHRNDPQLKDLSDEIALSRSFLEAALAKLTTVSMADLSTKSMVIVQSFVDGVARLVEVHSRIETKLETTITENDVYMVINQITDIIRKYVVDEDVLFRLADDIAKIRLPVRGKIKVEDETGATDEDAADDEAGEELPTDEEELVDD